MKFSSALVALGATAVSAVPSLEVQGRNFVNPSTGKVFQIVGMAYQIGGSAGYEPKNGIDPLSNGKVCIRDAALMQQLGVNTIRVYNVNPDLNHDECASIFNAAGIYMLLDVNSPVPNEALNAAEPWTSYNTDYLNRTFAVVEGFKNYPNTLAYFAGNEVINDMKSAAIVPPYMRSVTRDLKNYIKNNLDRQIPVGYSAADVREVLDDTFQYLTCSLESQGDDVSQADIFALNSYSWCGDASYQSSGYNVLTKMFENSHVPVFFSEFGCNTPSPRVFTEISAIYGDKMTEVFSGGVVYQWSQEENNYGLVKIKFDGDESGHLVKDYRTLQSQYAKVDFEKVQDVKAKNSKSTFPKCTDSLIKSTKFDSNFTLFDVPKGTEQIIKNGVKPAPSGKIIDISDYSSPYAAFDVDGSKLASLAVTPLKDGEMNVASSQESKSTKNGSGSDDDDSAAVSTAAISFAMLIPAVAALASLL